MDNNSISNTSSNKSNQHHDNTTNPSSLHSLSLPSTSLPPTLLPSPKEESSEATNAIKQNQATSLPSPSSHAPVKANPIISFNTDNINRQVKVLNRVAKASGKYKFCYNIEYLSPDNLMGQQTWIDLDNLDIISVENKPETTKTDEILLTNSQTFNIAKEKELKRLEDNNVNEIVPYNNQKCISVS